MSKANRDQHRSERAAAIQAAQARTERNRRMALVGAVVVVLAVLAAAGFWYTSGSGGSKEGDVNQDLAASAGDHSLVVGGNDEAKVKVVVYEDFLCPYCREFEMASRDYLHEYADQGIAQVEYRPFHLLPDDYSLRALKGFAAVLEADPATALKFHDVLFDEQPYEQAADKPDAGEIADWAADAGADASAVARAIESDDTSWADAADAAARKAGVQGTPTIFVNGDQLQGSSIADMSDNLEAMLGKAAKK
jgi:protein-disulfide isomerase